ncbi:DNA polymerase alpha, subunit B [Guyanagaster necrorhizus]|uniref:DNA polymerase alpha subunit B n=1 Tax=Guyanagaster necrorhizus TaxID=856835 RepID=A0A9P7VN76_9AGAR|nr:DNA polymerase alpha, subunit B [Guyanagaster necrorhizus MCA 3950]KAG7443006.1 DNA polymerase alpha, subunit B [Guyanagaster necrorhizus MCA 3950]
MSVREIREQFGDDLDEKLVEECVSMCKIYQQSAEDLFYKWESIHLNLSSRSEIRPPFTMDSVASLKASLNRGLAAGSKKAQPKPKTMRGGRNLNPAFAARYSGASHGTTVKTESDTMVVDIPASVSAAVTYKGPKEDMASRKRRAYRYMYEKVSERSEVLDEQIDEFAELIREHYKIPVSGFSDPASSTDEEVTVVGRIVQESESEPGTKLTETSLTLETSRMLGSGSRVPLRFTPSLKIRGGALGAGGISFFPGALVALKGKNGGVGSFLASEVLAPPPLRTRSSRAFSDPNFSDSSFLMYIASGPYTSDLDLGFKPWRAFLPILKSKKPTVVVLIGPFIDASHPLLKAGAIDTTPLKLFHAQFTKPLRSYLDSSPGSIAILVPSVRDLVSFHAVYPQCEFSSEVSNRDSRIHLLSNPAQFSINNIKVAVTSVDVLFHLRKEELLKRGEEIDSIVPSSPEDTGTDSMANTCRHVLQQRSFYPLFPVPQELAHEVNLDVTHSQLLKLGESDNENVAPDVLIIPSRLKHFSKSLDTTSVLNPSFLTKGTYAVVQMGLGGVIKLEIVKMDSS